MPLSPGTRLGAYVIKQPLGAGGMGEVYRAHDDRLAREVAPLGRSGVESQPTRISTMPGTVLGTVGYMAPEQARGQTADHRADIFSFGCVLYEIIAGRPAFVRESGADTLSAILKEDPPPLATATIPVPAALDRVIARCLEKQPSERFQSARDLAFALETLSASGSSASAVAAPSRRRLPLRLTAAIVAVATLAGAFAVGRQWSGGGAAAAIDITRLTFESGVIRSARFAPDGETIVYGASWDGARARLDALDLATKRRTFVREIVVGNPAGILHTPDLLLSADAGTYVYNFARLLSTLYLVDGLCLTS